MKFIYSLWPTSPLIYDLFILFNFQVLFNQSLIPDFSILDPDFPVDLEVLLIKIIPFFLTTEVISCSKIINTFKLQNSWTNPFQKSSIWDFYSVDIKCCKTHINSSVTR